VHPPGGGAASLCTQPHLLDWTAISTPHVRGRRSRDAARFRRNQSIIHPFTAQLDRSQSSHIPGSQMGNMEKQSCAPMPRQIDLPCIFCLNWRERSEQVRQ